MTRSAIDIGTNSVLLLVAEKKRKGIIEPIHEEQRLPRLGKGVDAQKVINEASTQRVVDVLLEYKTFLKNSYPDAQEPIVTATSAVRDAYNRDEFIQIIKAKTGYDIRLLSGKDEARWTAAGALSMIETPKSGRGEYLILDIGGGSTEVAHVRDQYMVDKYSFDMGSVRFTERFLKHDPAKKDEIKACRDFIKKTFRNRFFHNNSYFKAVGVAGTVTSLAAIIMESDNYDPTDMNDVIIYRDEINDVIEKFIDQPSDEMLNSFPNVLEGRSDIFLAGLLILEGFMERFGREELTVSTGGIRHGAILNTK
ncbi:Ppx/GppA family phosphatase [Gracilimonas sp. Q87]|uniref:Ppx/GppA phosphatase family protein n=1 Tax=Gracilimonas sp. Q87 TaxID=3384766 RepID=UPI003983DB50